MLATERVELMEMPLEVLSHTTTLFLAGGIALHRAAARSRSPAARATRFDATITVVAFWQAGVWASAAVTAWLERKRKGQLASDRAAASSIGVVAFIARAVVWVMVVLLALENLGVNITRWSPASVSAASPSRWPCRTSWATCSHRCRSPSTSRSSWATS